MIEFDTSKTLDELEGDDWGVPQFDSHLVTTCHRLRKKPLSEFTDEDLRILIGQNIGLDFLVPLALRHLDQYPLAAGDVYDGALLKAVVNADPTWRESHPDLWYNLDAVVEWFKEIAELYQTEIGPASHRLKNRMFGVTEGKPGATPNDGPAA